MAEPKTFNLELELERYQLPGVCKAILHTIVFMRAFGTFQPVDVDLDFVDMSYARVSDNQVEQEITEKVNDFGRLFDQTQTKSQIIALKFVKKATGFMGTEQCWEQWVIKFDLTAATREERARRTHKLETELNGLMFQIVRFVMAEKSHIPQIEDAKLVCPFPFRIVIGTTNTTSLWRAIRDFIPSAPPGGI